MKILLLTLVLAGCAGTLPPPTRLGSADVKVIERVVYPVSPSWWRSSMWYNQFTDPATPNRVVIAGQMACVQEAGTTDDPRPGQVFHCAEGWRAPGGHVMGGQ